MNNNPCHELLKNDAEVNTRCVVRRKKRLTVRGEKRRTSDDVVVFGDYDVMLVDVVIPPSLIEFWSCSSSSEILLIPQ